MHPLAARVVRAVLDEGGTIDILEAFDDLKELDDAARKTEHLPIWRVCELIDRPVIVGDADARRGRPAVLWRPSYAALEWISDVAALCGVWQDLCVAWALAHARSPRAFREEGANPPRAIRAAKAWASDLNCSATALMTATQRLLEECRTDCNGMANSSSKGEKKQPPDRVAARMVLARLVREFGMPEDYWLFGPLDRLHAALELLRQSDEAEARAVARASGRVEARDPNNPEVLAFLRWRSAAEAFRSKYAPKKSS